MKIKNINPQHDNLRVAALAGQLVKYEEEVDVTPEVAAVLLIQTDMWEPVDDEANTVLADALPAHLEQLAEASAAGVVSTNPDLDPAADEPVAEPATTLDADLAAIEAAAAKAEAEAKAAADAKAAAAAATPKPQKNQES